jgi:hypothetical protein
MDLASWGKELFHEADHPHQRLGPIKAWRQNSVVEQEVEDPPADKKDPTEAWRQTDCGGHRG